MKERRDSIELAPPVVYPFLVSFQISGDFLRNLKIIAPVPMARKANMEGSGTTETSRTCKRFNMMPGDIVKLCAALSATNVPIIYCPGAPLPMATEADVLAPPVKVELPDWPPRPSFNHA